MGRTAAASIDTGGSSDANYGGAICLVSTSGDLTIDGCEFLNNETKWDDGGGGANLVLSVRTYSSSDVRRLVQDPSFPLQAAASSAALLISD